MHNIARAIFKSWFIDYEPWEGCRPQNWREGQLGECLSTIESGSRPKGGAESEGIPSIGAENIECFGVYDFSKEKFISQDFFCKMKRGKVRSGDVLLYKDGAYTGKSSLALDDFPHAKCAINEHVFILRTNEILPSQFFLYMFLSVEENRKTLSTMASSKAAQPGLNQTEVSILPIEIPEPEDVQNFDRRITPIMKQIARNAKENRHLSTLRDALLPRLMSGELDVSELDI